MPAHPEPAHAARNHRSGPPPPPPRFRPGPRPAAELDAAADAVMGLLDNLDPYLLVVVLSGGRDADDLAVRPIPADPRCGGAGLFGLTAPAGSLLVGASFPVQHEDTDALVDIIVTCTGTVRSRLREQGGAPRELPTPAGGVVVDALHRLLGLPAPGEPPPLAALYMGLWLHQLLPPALDGRQLTWAAAVDAYPDPPACGPVPPSVETLARSATDVVRTASWDGLRQATAIGRLHIPELAPEEAAWMDSTLFARWLVESFPPLEDALEVLVAQGASEVAAGVAAVARHLGLTVEVGGT